MTDGPAPLPDQWVSIQEAAQQLGISAISVRRRIRKGTLEAELQPGPKGNEYRVRLPAEYSAEFSPPDQVSSQVISEMLAVITRQQADLIARVEAAAEWKTKAELLDRQVSELRVELTQARERIRALEAPKPEPVAVEPTSEPEVAPEATARRWWRFWD